MIPATRLHRRFSALVVILLGILVVPSAFAKGKPGGGSPPDSSQQCFNLSAGKPIIALDPGHGGTDSGTGYDFDNDGTKDLLEKDVVLNIAFLTRDALVGQGYGVCLTRIDDTALGNSERGDFANAVGARLFVMIHLHGSTNKDVDYTSTFWGKKRKDLAFSEHMLAALQDLTTGGGDFVGQFASGALLSAQMESTLTESLFLTNTAEAFALREPDSEHRKEIANAIAHGLHSYLNPTP